LSRLHSFVLDYAEYIFITPSFFHIFSVIFFIVVTFLQLRILLRLLTYFLTYHWQRLTYHFSFIALYSSLYITNIGISVFTDDCCLIYRLLHFDTDLFVLRFHSSWAFLNTYSALRYFSSLFQESFPADARLVIFHGFLHRLYLLFTDAFIWPLRFIERALYQSLSPSLVFIISFHYT